jgi:cytochrome c oxidase subunit 2
MMELLTRPFMLEPASAHAGEIDRMIGMVHWLMFLLFVGWSAFFVYMLFRFRQRKGVRADHAGSRSHSSTWLEIGVAAVEAVLLIFFAIPLWAERVDNLPDEKDAVVLRVVGEQFAWNVHYPGADGKFGRTSVDKIDLASNPLGLDREDEAAKDDITTVNQLHLPVGRPALIHLSSKDVIHSFNLPHMRVKQDTIPGLSIPTWFVPTVTTEEMRQKTGDDEFVYEIACAQLCGLGHASMRGFLTVHTPEGFQAWLDEQAASQAAPVDEFWE